MMHIRHVKQRCVWVAAELVDKTPEAVTRNAKLETRRATGWGKGRGGRICVVPLAVRLAWAPESPLARSPSRSPRPCRRTGRDQCPHRLDHSRVPGATADLVCVGPGHTVARCKPHRSGSRGDYDIGDLARLELLDLQRRPNPRRRGARRERPFVDRVARTRPMATSCACAGSP